MLGPHDVGQRVVVRRWAGQRGDRDVFSDVLGEVVDLTETEITIRTRDRIVVVPVTEIAHAKRVPARRRLTATETLERIAAEGWPALERGYLGEWLLRASAGWTARGNSALPVGDPGRTLVDAVDAVQSWYRHRGLPPKIAVAEPVGGRLVAELTRRGWTPSPPVLVQTAALPATGEGTARDRAAGQEGAGQEGAGQEGAGQESARQESARQESARQESARQEGTGQEGTGQEGAGDEGAEQGVRLDDAPPEAWFAAVGGYKGGLPDAARRVLTGVARARFAGVYSHEGTARAVGRGVIAGDGEWLGVSLVTVDPAGRRRGLGRAVVGALTGWAAAEGARRAYLQVEERNTAAVRMYTELGFTTHHRYVTWTAP